MSDTSKEHLPEASPAPELSENAKAQETRTRKPRKRQAPVYTYLIILFLAAFLLLALSYFMQQRNLAGMGEALDNLKDSVSSMQGLEAIQAENEALQEENELLQQQVEALTSERDSLLAAKEELSQATQAAEALEWLRQIQVLYEQEYYRYARPLIQEFEATGLPQALPDSSVVDTENDGSVESPAAAYQRIVDALFPDGIPAAEETAAP